MATAEIMAKLKEGQTFTELLSALHGTVVDGKPIKMSVDQRTLPYLKHVVTGFTDGPGASKIEAILAGQQPGAHKWRRFTIRRTGPGIFLLDAFPTPFNNSMAPLAPGIPPSASRHDH